MAKAKALPKRREPCDRCTAWAKVRILVNISKGTVLDFCQHHYDIHETHIAAKGYRVLKHG